MGRHRTATAGQKFQVQVVDHMSGALTDADELGRTGDLLKCIQQSSPTANQIKQEVATDDEPLAAGNIVAFRATEPGDSWNKIPAPLRWGLGGIPVGGNTYLPVPIFPRTGGCNVM